MVCQSCGKPKADLSPKKSAIAPGVQHLLCPSCRENKFEPRYMIIIVGRSRGVAAVREQIVKHLYVGDDITALELTP